ncbi:MAG: formylglycine-generating enzyme family protein [Verrucomicrobiota bacterium]|nr:formylglycine-generating enzyme family protein [Verrucomicrobiota bacterium]
MLGVNLQFPVPLPDDPNKWDGWAKYKSPNFYERLCLDPRENPSNETIEEHCRALLRWWQKKLPLKNQPTNPLAQLLRPGLEESSRYLTEARVLLLSAAGRKRIDHELAAQAQEQAIAEFHKYLTFAIADGTLTADEEKNLLRFGQEHGLTAQQMAEYVEAELRDSGATRASIGIAQPAPEPVASTAPQKSADPKEEFLRMLRLTSLDSDGMADETRDAFINMAENMGLDPGDAEDLVDLYLGEVDQASNPPPAPAAPVAKPVPIKPLPEQKPEARVQPIVRPTGEVLPPFVNSLGAQMLCVPGGEFAMGSNAADAGPNEQPISRVTLSRYFISKHPITNAEYEQFDGTHVRKRAPGTGDRHPVVHVSSLDAIKFCQWLSTRERKRYRLPTEAEWEFAARGKDGRKYPWGNHERRGDLANFADKNTVFAWSDREISDGYPESSPVGAFPNGASPFGLLDMAGNVWEWCLDYFEPYRNAPRVNPRGATSGQKRIYRGGSWKSRFNSLRATTRSANVPAYSCNDLGFRVVCECE